MRDRKITRLTKFLSLFFVGIFLFLVGIFALTTLAAGEFSYSININYQVPQKGPTKVVETYNVTNNTSNKYLDSIKLSSPSSDVKNLQVYYVGGGSIPFTTETVTQESSGFKYDYTQINIDFTTAKVGSGLRWGFVVEYETNSLVENKGRANVIYIPGIAQENKDSYNVRLSVPDTFGPVHGFGTIPREVSRQAGIVTYAFGENDLVDNSLQLLFGDSTTYKAVITYPLKNESGFDKNYEISLPPNTASQSVFIQSLEPKPTKTSLDKDGNIIAYYSLGPKQNLDVKADILADVKYLNYNLAKSGTIKDLPATLVNEYTKPTKYWPSDNADIQAKAKELTQNKKTVADKIEAINKYVIDTLTYNNEKIKYNIRQGGLKALQNPANVVCLEYSDLSISLLRAAGIPARMPVGYGYSGDLKLSASVSDSLHSWVEAYVPNVGWINLDPTWGEKFNNFGISDIDHLTFAIWGAEDSKPAVISENGSDTNYQYEKATLSYVEYIPEPSKDATLKVNKWVLLPFIAVAEYQIKSPSNSATTNLELVIEQADSKTRKLIGSTAPSQKITGYLPILGLNFATLATAKIFEQNSVLPLAMTDTSTSYWPMVIILLIISVIITLTVVKLLNKKHHKEPIIDSEKNLYDKRTKE